MNLFEMYGRQAEQYERLHSTWLKTIELLQALKAGEVKLKDIEVDESGWRVS